MWQRIQTLYFALATIMLTVLAFGNVGSIITPDAPVEDIRYLSKLPYAILIILSLALNLVSTFSWKHRALQIRLGGAGIVLLLALQIWLGVDYFTLSKEFVFKWTAIFPIIAAVSDLFAMKGVLADEMLVRSASRLRSSKRTSKK